MQEQELENAAINNTKYSSKYQEKQQQKMVSAATNNEECSDK